MKKLKLIASTVVVFSVLALNLIGASATNLLSIEQAKSIIINNGDIYNSLSPNDVSFKAEISPGQLKEYTIQNVDNIVDNQENLYTFFNGVTYFVGVNSGYLYEYDGGSGTGAFKYIENNKAVKEWYWERERVNNGWNYDTGWKQHMGWENYENTWYYYNNGVMQTGWIYDNGNWYYCYSNGKMASNTTIDGYKLNSNGAWIN